MDTRQFLVFAGEHVLGFAGLVQFVVETDDFGGLVAIVALGGFVQSADFVQFALQVAVDAFEMLAAFLEVAGVGVGLRSIEKRELYNGRKRERERERERVRDWIMQRTFSRSMMSTSTSLCRRDFCFSRPEHLEMMALICSSSSVMRTWNLRLIISTIKTS